MRVLGYMVTRDEADRYLASCLDWNLPQVDALAVYDDCSSDDSVEIARNRGAKVCVRGSDVPPFVTDEAAFRNAALEWFEDVLEPEVGDWVLALDADEFVLGDVREEILHGYSAVSVPISEVFDAEGPQIRVDGYWREIRSSRLYQWYPNGKFELQVGRAMGCGAVPSYVDDARPAKAISILHYGYATHEDRIAKSARYLGAAHGHNEVHIRSILARPGLHLWAGDVPLVQRGLR